MKRIPLAKRIRPTHFDEVLGQDHIVSADSPFRKLAESNKLSSVIFYGQAGTGKTTIAEIIANCAELEFFKLNATSTTVKDIRKYAKKATDSGDSIVLFLDEIHRLSRTQIDVLLPFTEDGDIILIGATTENPFFTVHQSILSRSQIYELNPLSKADLVRALKRGIEYLPNNVRLNPDAARHIVSVSAGDARKALSLLEISAEVADNGEITEEIVNGLAPSKYMVFGDDVHYDLASAFQGSIQASDPNAAIYWLAKWLESGEDPRYIARRLLVAAAEDAFSNPMCTAVAHAAYTSACEIGRPECDIVLAQATIMVAKSDRDKTAAKAIWAAVSDIKSGLDLEVPKELKDCHYPGAKKLGHGKYQDGHDISEYVGISKKYLQE